MKEKWPIINVHLEMTFERNQAKGQPDSSLFERSFIDILRLKFVIPGKVGELHEMIKTKLNVHDGTIHGLVNQITQWSISERRPISEFVEHDLLGSFSSHYGQIITLKFSIVYFTFTFLLMKISKCL